MRKKYRLPFVKYSPAEKNSPCWRTENVYGNIEQCCGLLTSFSQILRLSELLSQSDKAKIKATYDSFDVETMWTWTTGKKVEQQMEKWALACNYEHPCHSLIMDAEDNIWDDRFTKEELNEIDTYNNIPFPPLPTELTNYLYAM
ncbi:unnamed protein product [Absidia cylindrospora]